MRTDFEEEVEEKGKWRRRSGIMLAYPFEERRLLKWEPPYIVQPKLDGQRCRAILTDGCVHLLSSEENIIEDVPQVLDACLQLYERIGRKSLELDGELYLHGLAFNEIMTATNRQELQLHVFDIIDIYETQTSRLLTLCDLSELFTPALQLVPFFLAEDFESLMRCYDLFISQGYEGFIVRHHAGRYKRIRSLEMMKFKPKKDDVYIVAEAFEAISADGTPKGMLGGFWVYGSIDPMPFKVGAGHLTHEERKLLWEQRDQLPGRKLLVEYQALTERNKVPRFGRAVRFV